MTALPIIWPREKIDTSRIFPKSNILTPKVARLLSERVNEILLEKESSWLVHPDRPHSTRPQNQKELDTLIWVSLKFVEDGIDDAFNLPHTKLTLFSDYIDSECGPGLSQMWPFFCPLDKKIYLDPTFFRDMLRYYSEAEDFVVFYVLAHEYAHYIQDQITFPTMRLSVPYGGGSAVVKVSSILELKTVAAQYLPKSARNKIEQVIELHADYLAGVITHHSNKRNKLLEENDIREWLETALYIGDDIMQLRQKWRVTPHTFTHGSWVQRAWAFAEWLQSGDATRFTLENIVHILKRELASPYGDVQMFEI